MNPDPLAFFDRVYQSYQAAETAVGGSVGRFYQIDEFVIKLQFAGNALISALTPALAHLEIPPVSNPDLTICGWDSISTQVSMPPPAWDSDDYRQRGEIRGFITDRFHTSLQGGSNALSILDLDRNLAVYWIDDHQQIPYWENGAPLRTIFHIWLSQRGIQLVHGGAVGTRDGGVLLVGKGGSGKSTTALSCLQSKLSYASDDYTLVKIAPEPRVFSLYSTGKKNADDLERLPFLATAVSNRDRLDAEKALYFINEYFPDQILSSFPLKAILIPRVTGKRDTYLQPASAGAALLALAPSTIFQLPGAKNSDFKIMTDIIRNLKCYYLDVGTDITQIPQVIIKLLVETIEEEENRSNLRQNESTY